MVTTENREPSFANVRRTTHQQWKLSMSYDLHLFRTGTAIGPTVASVENYFSSDERENAHFPDLSEGEVSRIEGQMLDVEGVGEQDTGLDVGYES